LQPIALRIAGPSDQKLFADEGIRVGKRPRNGGETTMFRLLAALAIAAQIGPAWAESTLAPRVDRLATLQLIERDLLRDDSRVFRNREGSEAIEVSLVVAGAPYRLELQRPSRHEFLLVLEGRDGARCPGVQTIIVGTRSGRIYQGVCRANVALNVRRQPAYYEAELDRLLRVFHPLLAPYASARPRAS
jgi:hypothetical protein